MNFLSFVGLLALLGVGLFLLRKYNKRGSQTGGSGSKPIEKPKVP